MLVAMHVEKRLASRSLCQHGDPCDWSNSMKPHCGECCAKTADYHTALWSALYTPQTLNPNSEPLVHAMVQ